MIERPFLTVNIKDRPGQTGRQEETEQKVKAMSSRKQARDTRRPPNPWNEFQPTMRGAGLTREELLARYHEEKSAKRVAAGHKETLPPAD